MIAKDQLKKKSTRETQQSDTIESGPPITLPEPPQSLLRVFVVHRPVRAKRKSERRLDNPKPSNPKTKRAVQRANKPRERVNFWGLSWEASPGIATLCLSASAFRALSLAVPDLVPAYPVSSPPP